MLLTLSRNDPDLESDKRTNDIHPDSELKCRNQSHKPYQQIKPAKNPPISNRRSHIFFPM
jgi:hypothetical protein